MHLEIAEETIAATSLMKFAAVKWTCMASVIWTEVQTMIHTLRSSGIPSAPTLLEAAPAPSDEDDRKKARWIRFNLPSLEAVGNAIFASATNEENDNLMAETRIKEAERDTSPDY